MVSSWAQYAAPTPLLRDHGLVCLGAGEQSDARTGFSNRRLDSHALVFVSSGAGEYHDRRVGRRTVSSPAVIRVPPGRLHGYGPAPDGWTEHWLLFDGVTVRALLDLGAFDTRRPVAQLRQMPAEVPEFFAELRGVLESARRSARVTASALCLRLIALAAEVEIHDEDADRVADRVIAALREHAADRIEIAERARRLGLSPATLRAVVHEATGRSPHEFIVTTRIERAQDLLVRTELPVGAIGAAVGYDDPAFFSRLFARKAGVPPTEFRAQHTRRPPSP
ncbi:AraC family transcriptional regulator [Isoptericola hypogeus]|uniref:helix-turn-helix domain-containing protein n=1 Tax=Isoptericola hypogeus TaxID=300179 RepID=UPI0031D2ADD4